MSSEHVARNTQFSCHLTLKLPKFLTINGCCYQKKQRCGFLMTLKWQLNICVTYFFSLSKCSKRRSIPPPPNSTNGGENKFILVVLYMNYLYIATLTEPLIISVYHLASLQSHPLSPALQKIVDLLHNARTAK
jgi:hypothetical protein